MTTPINPVGWFEIYVNDMPRATAFYEAVLQTKLTALPTPAVDVQMMAFPGEYTQPGATGALAKMDGFSAGGNSTIIYFSSADCAVEESRIVAAGGGIHKSKMGIGEYGFIVLATDTEGNMFGVHSIK